MMYDGDGWMWHGGWGWGGWALMALSMAVFWAVVITLVILAVRYLTSDRDRSAGPQPGPTASPAEVLGPGVPAQGYQRPGMRMMSILVDPTTVPSGQVSFRVVNAGAWVHELAVLPLGPGQDVGQRPIGAINQVDESAQPGG